MGPKYSIYSITAASLLIDVFIYFSILIKAVISAALFDLL